MRGRECHVSQHIGLGLVEEGGELRQLGTQLIGDPAPLCLGSLGVVLSEGGGDEGGDDTAALLPGITDSSDSKSPRTDT